MSELLKVVTIRIRNPDLVRSAPSRLECDLRTIRRDIWIVLAARGCNEHLSHWLCSQTQLPDVCRDKRLYIGQTISIPADGQIACVVCEREPPPTFGACSSLLPHTSPPTTTFIAIQYR